MYRECPQKYYFTYVEAIPSPINEKVFLGQIFHETLEDYFTRRINGFSPDEKTIAAAFIDAFEAQAKQKEIVWNIPHRETRARGLAFVNYFLAHLAPAMKPLMVEKELSADIQEIGVTLKGVIDLLETDFSITDFKTTTGKWSAGQGRKSLQMVIYKYLFDRNFGNVHGVLKYEILYAKNASRVRHQSLPVSPGADDIAQMLLVIEHVARNISQDVFYPQAGPFCAHCDFLSACRARNHGLN